MKQPYLAFVLILGCFALAMTDYWILSSLFGLAAIGALTAHIWATYHRLRAEGKPVPHYLTRPKLFRWIRVLQIRHFFWKYGLEPGEETRRRWRNYVATGDPTRGKDG